MFDGKTVVSSDPVLPGASAAECVEHLGFERFEILPRR